MELFDNTSDIVLVRSTIALGYVKESKASILKTVTDYETVTKSGLLRGGQL